MTIWRTSHPMLFRYDKPDISCKILAGSVRVSTFKACREAENDWARDCDDGKKTTTSLPGVDYPTSQGFADLLGVDPNAITIEGPGVKLVSENAVRRNEQVEAFVFCTSMLVNAPHMKKRFGDGCIRIRDPRGFIALVDEYLRRQLAPQKIGQCVVGAVEYTPRTNNYRDHTKTHVAFIKEPGAPKHFENEAEVRAVWIPENFRAEPVTLQIPEISGLLELV